MRATVAAGLLAAVGGVGACGHPAPVATPANASPASPRFGGDDLSLIPAAAQFVINVDVNAVRNSPVYTELLGPQLAKEPEVSMVKTACGFDPMATVTSVTFAANGGMSDAGPPEKGNSELVIHGIPRDKATACVPKLIAQAGASIKVSQDGDTWMFVNGQRPIAVRFIGDDVMLVALGTIASRAGIDHVLASSATALPTSSTFNEMRGKLHAASVWFVATGDAIIDLVGMMGINAAFGTVDLHDGGLAANATLRFDTPTNAQQQADKLKSDSAPAMAFVNRLDIAATGNEIAVAVALDRTKLDGVLGLARGGMGGGMGGGPMPVPPNP
jgi:hypothetical protein